jgi:hypothetical protein
MSIQRSGPTPSFYEYICNYLLIPHTTTPSPQVLALTAPGQQLSWLDIPSFQRGISWDIEKVTELLRSTSVLLGNAILAQFANAPGQFPNLPSNQSNHHVLVDGLQRFAVGTAFLSTLHQEVLAPSPNRPGDAAHFAALAARVVPLAAFYMHNNAEFLAHPRKAIKDQYVILRNAITSYCLDELNKGKASRLAGVVVPLFLTRQLALDIYFNFNRPELLNTFIGINTVRVDLGPVDLLRATLLEKGTTAGWSAVDLETTENEFTDSLTDVDKPKQDYVPFVNSALKAISTGFGPRLFPSWNSGLQKSEVDDFLGFVDEFEVSTNPYLTEIRLCGKLPASMLFAYYYLQFVHNGNVKPSFFVGGTAENSELHSFLLLCYRLVIDGTVGRTTDYLEGMIDGSTALTLSQLADTISVDYFGRPISTPVDQQWLESQLNKLDKKRAPRVFNAMLLPPKASLGAAYQPITFGAKSKEFHVDHLIPESMLNLQAPGGSDGQTLRNFAPLPSNQNRVAKGTSCSSKLAPGGIYDQYCSGTAHLVHPYSLWLLGATVAPYAAVLDIQANLERNKTPDVGTHRIKEVISQLLPRI